MDKQNIFCWADIPVIDLDRAIQFYSMMLAQPVQKIEEEGFVFGLLPHTENSVSGCLCVMEERQPSQQGPLVYFNVEGRLNEAVKAVEQHGGKIIKQKEKIGSYGHRAVLIDTEGNAVALYSFEA